VATAGVGVACASPTSDDSLRVLLGELARLVGRERTRAFIERTVAAAGMDLTPGAAWLLVRAEEGMALDDPEGIAADRPFGAAWVREQLAGLEQRGLLDGVALTQAGHETAARLLRARCDALHALVADWEPGDDPRVDEAIDRLALELARVPPSAAAVAS
jgi:hypothetical protein